MYEMRWNKIEVTMERETKTYGSENRMQLVNEFRETILKLTPNIISVDWYDCRCKFETVYWSLFAAILLFIVSGVISLIRGGPLDIVLFTWLIPSSLFVVSIQGIIITGVLQEKSSRKHQS